MNVEALRVLFNSPLWIPEKWMVKQLVLNLVFHYIKIQITSFHYLTP
jgi:hypothetical protein